MDINYIKKNLQPDNIIGKEIIYLKQTTSANDILKKLIKKNIEQGTVVITDYQTKGRGRHGNSWEAELETAILLSILFYPKTKKIDYNQKLVDLSAECIKEIIEKLVVDKKVWIKHPNDVYVEDKKISGILVESSTKASKIEYAVLGIGININNKEFSDEVKNTATSLFLLNNKVYERESIIVELLNKLYLKIF
jgi:BirA family transcriptional regulator, biotin operon repressor / biotin---[acetyl-CoA-carboxylase] ligase